MRHGVVFRSRIGPGTVSLGEMDKTPFLWLCGPPGAGKTTVAWEIFTRLERQGVKSAYVDADQVGMCYPGPDDDPGNDRVKARGLGAVWAGFKAAGAQCLIMSGSVDSAETVRSYADQVRDTDLSLCELAADPEVLRERLIGRGDEQLIDGALREAAALERDRITGIKVDTTRRSVVSVADRVLELTGRWPGSGTPQMRPPEPPIPTRAGDGDRLPMLWVCGPPGVGKSTAAFGVFMRVMATGAKAAYIDLAQIGWCRPTAHEDPDNHLTKARNLGELWRVHRAAGARCLIVSGPVGEWEAVRRYLEAVPDCRSVLCRLSAGRDELTERIRLRGRGAGPELPGDDLRGRPVAYLERFADLAVNEAASLERRQIGDFEIDTNGLSPEETADLLHAKVDL